jgi:hypothetical protein
LLQLPGMRCGATRTCSRKRQTRGVDTPDDAGSGGYLQRWRAIEEMSISCLHVEGERSDPAITIGESTMTHVASGLALRSATTFVPSFN